MTTGRINQVARISDEGRSPHRRPGGRGAADIANVWVAGERAGARGPGFLRAIVERPPRRANDPEPEEGRADPPRQGSRMRSDGAGAAAGPARPGPGERLGSRSSRGQGAGRAEAACVASVRTLRIA
jgi:hypothetical protein